MIRIRLTGRSLSIAVLLLAHVSLFHPKTALAWQPPPVEYNQDDCDDYDYGAAPVQRPEISCRSALPTAAETAQNVPSGASMTVSSAMPAGPAITTQSSDNRLNPAIARWLLVIRAFLRR